METPCELRVIKIQLFFDKHELNSLNYRVTLTITGRTYFLSNFDNFGEKTLDSIVALIKGFGKGKKIMDYLKNASCFLQVNEVTTGLRHCTFL